MIGERLWMPEIEQRMNESGYDDDADAYTRKYIQINAVTACEGNTVAATGGQE